MAVVIIKDLAKPEDNVKVKKHYEIHDLNRSLKAKIKWYPRVLILSGLINLGLAIWLIIK